MRKYLYLVIVSLCLFCYPSWAQEQIVRGTVVDENGEGLVGVTVQAKGTTVGTITDLEGNFSLTLPGDVTTLVFSSIGFKRQEVLIGNQTQFSITLAEDIAGLEEIVVVGYGEQKKKVVTGAVNRVGSEEITQTPILSVDQALQGRVPGVSVASTNGQPGAAPSVIIRGAGTNGFAGPLYIVDGIQQLGGIDYLNPNDIESIDILKDATAGIYGTRAANGVVIITTKSGKKGKAQVSYDGYVGFQNPWRKLDLLNAQEYALLWNEAHAASGRTLPFDDPRAFGEGTDWQEEIFNDNAPITNHQLTITGGNDKSTYAASLGYFYQEGIIGGDDKSEFERITARINSTHQVSKRFTFGQNLTYSRLEPRGIDGNNEFSGPLIGALNMDPITPVFETDPDALATYDPDAVTDGNGNVYGISPFVTQEIVNPLARLEVTNQRFGLDKIVGNFFGEYEIIDGLKLRTSFGIDMAYGTNENFRPVFFLNAAQRSQESRVDKSVFRAFNWIWESTLTYQKSFGDHNFTVLLGNTVLEETFEDVGGGRSGLVFDDFNNAFINATTNEESATIFGGASENSLLSYFGRVNYDYQNRYLFSFIFRADGSSRFGENNQFAYFPTVSAGWVLSEEAFLSNVTFLDLLKLRVSWGQNGNQQIPNYAFGAPIAIGAGYSFGNSDVFTSGAVPARLPNPDLEWETSEQTDIGVDATFLQGQLSLTADYYIKKTRGLLLVPPLLLVAGTDEPFQNAGDVENRGVEVAITYRKAIQDFKFSATANFAYNKNEFVRIDNGRGFIPGVGFSTYGTVTRGQEGEPIGYFWGFQTDGLFQTAAEVESYVNADGELLQPNAEPGDIRFVDVNGDGRINDDGDRTNIGNPFPDWTLGANFSAEYKGFDLNIFFQGALGHQVFNGTRRHDLIFSNAPAEFLNRWTGPGTSNSIPRFVVDDRNGNFSRISDFYIEDADYLRLKDIQLGYSLPQKALEFLNVERFRVYVAAFNVFTITNYSGYEPEVGGGPLASGIDRGVYPQARSYRFGVNLTF